jgi:hypothetical protein
MYGELQSRKILTSLKMIYCCCLKFAHGHGRYIKINSKSVGSGFLSSYIWKIVLFINGLGSIK